MNKLLLYLNHFLFINILNAYFQRKTFFMNIVMNNSYETVSNKLTNKGLNNNIVRNVYRIAISIKIKNKYSTKYDTLFGKGSSLI